MDLASLRDTLISAGVSERAYSFDSDGFGEVYRIAPINDSLGDGWEVYYSERGDKNDLVVFRSQSEACEELLRRILRDSSARRKLGRRIWFHRFRTDEIESGKIVGPIGEPTLPN